MKKAMTFLNSEAARLTIASHQLSDSNQNTGSINHTSVVYPPLVDVTKPNLTTAEIAYYTNQAEQTWRAHACKETFPEGLRPIRIGNRLNWPTAGVKKLCGV